MYFLIFAFLILALNFYVFAITGIFNGYHRLYFRLKRIKKIIEKKKKFQEKKN